MKNIKFILIAAILAIVMAGCKSSTTSPSTTPGGSGIGPSGGTVTSSDGKVTVVIPSGALSSTQTIAIVPNTDSNTCPQALGAGYSLTPNGLTFSTPAMLTLHYDSTVYGANAEFIGVAYQDDKGNWNGVTGGSVDTIHRAVTVPISHFSNWTANLAFEITPATAVVFTGTSLTFEVDQVGPPAGSPAGPPVQLTNPFALVAASWKVNSSGGNSTVGTISGGLGQTATYSAPSQMPSPDLVTISATVTTNGNNYVVPSFIHVIARNWTLTGVDSLVYSCPTIITYTDVSGGYLDFQLEAGDFTATSFPWFPSGSNGTYNEAVCSAEASIVSKYTVTRGDDMSVSSIASGGYMEGSDMMFLRTNARFRDLPGYDITWTTGQSPTHVPISQGNNFEGALVFKNLSATNTWVDDHSSGSYLEHITWTLTAQ